MTQLAAAAALMVKAGDKSVLESRVFTVLAALVAPVPTPTPKPAPPPQDLTVEMGLLAIGPCEGHIKEMSLPLVDLDPMKSWSKDSAALMSEPSSTSASFQADDSVQDS